MTNIQCIVFNAKYANRWISSIDSILHSLTTEDNDGGERLASASVKFKRQEDNTKKGIGNDKHMSFKAYRRHLLWNLLSALIEIVLLTYFRR